MIDLLHLPEPDERTVWFPGQGPSTDTTGWRVWTKPRGVSMVSILAIGSGGGGGGGAGNISGSTAGGGAGGGGAAMAKMLFPAWALPDKLYVLCVSGGLGGDGGGSGSAGTAGIAGAASMVSIYPNTTAGNLLVTTLNGGLLGTAGTTFAGGGSGSAPTAPSAISAPLGQMAATQLFIQGTGRTGGSTGPTSNATLEIISRGAPGAGKSTGAGSAGSGYAAVPGTLLNAVPGGTAETAADAPSGFIHAGFHFAGCGGGGNNLGVGGRGGNGVAWGAGGGGGGGGLTGGRGGDGGPGLVIIASW